MTISIISRYVFTRFCINLFYCLTASTVIYVVIDYVGKLKKFGHLPVHVVAYYYLFVVPYIVNVIFCIVMLLASMFTMGNLAKNSEITAMRASGLSIFVITRPVLYLAFFLMILNFVFNETLLPKLNALRENMYRTLIKKRAPTSRVSRGKFYYLGKNNIIFHFRGNYDAQAKKGEDVDVEFYGESELLYRISCETLSWEGGRWVARNGSLRAFFKDSIAVRQFKMMAHFPVSIAEKPEDILRRRRHSDEMNFLELKRYLDSMIRAGESRVKTNKLSADLHFKISLPFISFILVLFGISLTVKVGKSGIARVFGLGLLIGFVYYFLVHLGLGLGKSGTVNPVLGAWLGNLVFFPISAVYFFKVSKLD